MRIAIIGTGNTIDMPGSNSLLVLDLSTSSDVYNIFVVASDRYNIIGANGSVSANFVERLQVTRAGGADTFYGWMQGDTFDGGAGNDVAYGSYGNDNLIGGDGDDLRVGQIAVGAAIVEVEFQRAGHEVSSLLVVTLLRF